MDDSQGKRQTKLRKSKAKHASRRARQVPVGCGQILVHTDAAGVDAMGCGVVRWAWWSMLDSTWAWVAIPNIYVEVEPAPSRELGTGEEKRSTGGEERGEMLTATGWDLVDVTLHWSLERGYSTSQSVRSKKKKKKKKKTKRK
ncbi:hypothetical protein MCOR07_007405 [Pyricularia oryzae]|nr:hypothetical protein MCOR07_007405 [Pyricularia oryzae]